mgnify:CR=1 FL=1
MTKTLKQKAVRSGSWVIVGHIFSQGLRLGGNLILTRLLVPEMFGIMAIVTVILGGLAMFSDVGLLQNIIQSKRGEESDYLNTAWTIQIVRGFLIFVIALSLSYGLYFLGQTGYLSEELVYGNVELPFILAIVSVTAVISGFNSIHMLVLNRKFMMGKLVTIELLSQLIGLFFMLYWAWQHKEIWALVYGNIMTTSTKMLLSHIVNIGGVCRFRWERKAAHEIFHFGKWVFLTSIFGFLLNQGDRLLLGGLLSAEVLGVYTIAFFLANALKDVITKLVSSVFFPVLSQVVREQPKQIQQIYYKIRAKIDIVSMFFAGFLYSSGSLIINSLYDQRYKDAGWMMEILSLSLASVGFMLAGQLFLANGKSKLMSILAASQVIGLYTFVPLMFFLYGVEAAIWAIALNPTLRVIVSLIMMKKYYFLSIFREILFTPFFVIGVLSGEQLQKIIILLK